jgi:hypothetical protein
VQTNPNNAGSEAASVKSPPRRLRGARSERSGTRARIGSGTCRTMRRTSCCQCEGSRRKQATPKNEKGQGRQSLVSTYENPARGWGRVPGRPPSRTVEGKSLRAPVGKRLAAMFVPTLAVSLSRRRPCLLARRSVAVGWRAVRRSKRLMDGCRPSYLVERFRVRKERMAAGGVGPRSAIVDGGRIDEKQSNRTRNARALQVAFPICTRDGFQERKRR